MGRLMWCAWIENKQFLSYDWISGLKQFNSFRTPQPRWGNSSSLKGMFAVPPADTFTEQLHLAHLKVCVGQNRCIELKRLPEKKKKKKEKKTNNSVKSTLFISACACWNGFPL